MSMEFKKHPSVRRFEKNLFYDPVVNDCRMKSRTTPPIKIPLVIVLKDGRTFDTIQLLIKVTASRSITLKVKNQAKPKSWTDQLIAERDPQERRGAPEKYTEEMRRWIAHSPLDEVVARFQTTTAYSRKMIHTYRAEFGLPSLKKRQ